MFVAVGWMSWVGWLLLLFDIVVVVVAVMCRLRGDLRGELDVKSKNYYMNLRGMVGRGSMRGREGG